MRNRYLPWLIAFTLLSACLWAYWTTLGEMAERWKDDPQYSHGYLVPAFSIFLLWSRRDRLKGASFSPSWWGIVLLFLGLAVRAAGVYFYYGTLDAMSLLLCLAGLALIVAGWPGFKWSWPAIAFLAFMAPLPFRLQGALGTTLQRIATKMSTYALQTCGAPAVSEGNIIIVGDVRIGVVEACSGLGMLVTFFAISTAAAMLLKKGGWWRRAILIVGAIPVAIVVNVIRITVTGLLYSASQNDAARIVFHDVAGWLMMPLAVLIIFLELHVMDRLIVDRAGPGVERGPIPFLPTAVPGTAIH